MILDPAWSRPLASFGVPIASINSERVLSFIAISSWNSTLVSSTSSLSILHLYIFLRRLLCMTLVCCRAVHTNAWSVVPTSVVHTRTSVSFPSFSTTM
ncbi:unnamed protein product [Ectocarpus sp. CCAP 1310/34]|nr:unnamed protein product [Ectocarpus sp. CCAP 1310/34]